MPRRTFEAIKAVRAALENERQLVLQGEGTRDWNPEQQRAIIDKGKAYDEDGKAFEGHHMKSVEAFPEYQGDSGNIQFLSRAEHKDAHGGNYQNPTNGYYDPNTGVTRDFGENKYESCEVIKLSEPIVSLNSSKQDVCKLAESEKEKSEDITAAESNRTETIEVSSSSNSSTKKTAESDKSSKLVLNEKSSTSIGDKVLCAVEAVKQFCKRHPILTGIVLTGTIAAAKAAVSYKGNYNSSSAGYTPSYDTDDDYSSSSDSEVYDEFYTESDYPDERSSPREHDVSGYDRQQNGKTVHVNPYKRGGSNKED